MTRTTSIDWHDVRSVLRRRRWVLLGVAWPCLAVAGIVIRSVPDLYESEVRVQMVSQGFVEQYVPTRDVPMAERLPEITQRVLSSERLEQIARELAAPGTAVPAPPNASAIRRNLTVRPAASNAFTIRYQAGAAITAQAVAAKVGAAFVDESRARAEGAAGAATDFLDTQLVDTRSRLEETERQLADFNTANAGELPAQLQTNLQLLQAAQGQLQTLRDALGRDRDEAMILDRQLQELTAASPEGGAGGVPSLPAGLETPLQQQLRTARAELQALQARFRAEHPDVGRAARRVSELEAQTATEPRAPGASAPGAAVSPSLAANPVVLQLQASRDRLARQIASRQAEERRIGDQIDSYTQRIEATPGREADLTRLTRDYGTLKDIYTKLLARKEEARVAANLQRNDIAERFAIAAPATLPGRPSSPNRIQLQLAAAVVSFALAAALAAFIEWRDTSVRTERQLRAVMQLPVLACIPVRQSPRDHRLATLFDVGALASSAALVATLVFNFWRALR